VKTRRVMGEKLVGDAVSRHVQRMYDRQAGREWDRMDRHRTEFAVTLRTLGEYLPPPPALILDCGGGPGRYAIELSRQGYKVTLFDLSSGNLNLAREKAAAAGVTLAGYEQGTATDLSRYPDNCFDAVLLMGPLYHLLEEQERCRALAESRRVLKSGGPLFAAFIARYAVMRWAAVNEPQWIVEHADLLEGILSTGVLPPEDEEGQSFFAYFAHPEEVGPLCRQAGLEMQVLLSAEGLVSMIEAQVNAQSGPAWDAWVELNWRVAADPALFGGVEHLLAVAVKPRWRAALQRIAGTLTAGGVPYTVVGGTSAALHGVPIAVKDIDIETTEADAYRCQKLFSKNVVEPVVLRSSDLYRSHLGRLDVDGVLVEVMGDLHRREGTRWVPTAAVTRETVLLDGVPVLASTLEEETLAYIRRQRLERAAACLPYCSPDRLLALLRKRAGG
jgi:S-adenosylmethionine-dependent methyltransferase